MTAAISMFPGHRSVPAPMSIEAEFEQWWIVYPRKIAKGPARAAYKGARRIASAADLFCGAVTYAKHAEPPFVCHPATWLRGERWCDEYPAETDERPMDEENVADRMLKAKCENMTLLGRRFPGISDEDLARGVEQGWLRRGLVEGWAK